MISFNLIKHKKRRTIEKELQREREDISNRESNNILYLFHKVEMWFLSKKVNWYLLKLNLTTAV